MSGKPLFCINMSEYYVYGPQGPVLLNTITLEDGTTAIGIAPSEENAATLTGPVKKIYSRFLDESGFGTGNKNANGDYSASPTNFLITPIEGEIIRVARMIVTIQASSGFRASRYGSGPALINGIEVDFTVNGKTTILTDGSSVMTNAEWGNFSYDVDLKSWGTGDEWLHVRWTFQLSGQMIRLDGSKGDNLTIILNDDLSSLTHHYFLVQGYIE